MKGRHQRGAVVVVKVPPEPADRLTAGKQGLRGEGAEGNNHLRRNRLNLAAQKRAAAGNLFGFGIAVAGRAALEQIADVDFLPGERHCRNHLRQQLPGLADKRLTLQVLIRAGRFTDEEHLCRRAAGAEDNMPSAFAKRAAAAIADVGADVLQSLPGRAGRQGRAALPVDRRHQGELQPQLINPGLAQILQVAAQRSGKNHRFLSRHHANPLYFQALYPYYTGMLQTALAVFLLLILPDSSFAWGPGFHLQLGTTVLGNLPLLPPAVAAVVGSFPNDFLYGSIAADITLGKKYTGYLLHCHRWHVGRNLLAKAATDAQRACAYGYISHLAADTVAHCYYVPLSIMRSYQSVVLKHAYWEVRFDSFTPPEFWALGSKVALEHFQENDALLRREIANTLFSFATNKKIFNSILLVSRLEKWQQLISAMNEVSRFQLDEEEKAEFVRLTEQAVLETLAAVDSSSWLAADPTGEQALQVAESVRKNLRILYQSGKITRDAAAGELGEMKVRLESAILQPELLRQIISAT
jgi:hypothetical protein